MRLFITKSKLLSFVASSGVSLMLLVAYHPAATMKEMHRMRTTLCWKQRNKAGEFENSHSRYDSHPGRPLKGRNEYRTELYRGLIFGYEVKYGGVHTLQWSQSFRVCALHPIGPDWVILINGAKP